MSDNEVVNVKVAATGAAAQKFAQMNHDTVARNADRVPSQVKSNFMDERTGTHRTTSVVVDPDLEAGTREEPKEEAKPAEPERPEWLPKEFKTVEEYVARAKSWQAEATKAQQALKAATAPKVAPTNGEAAATNGEAKAEPNGEAPPTATPLTDEKKYEFTEKFMKGALAPDDFNEIRKSYPTATDADITDHFEGLVARRQMAEVAMYEAAGGKRAFESQSELAKKHLTEEDRASYEAKLYSVNPKETAQGAKLQRALVESVVGRSGKFLMPSGGGNGAADTFANPQEYQDALAAARIEAKGDTRKLQILRKKVFEKYDRSGANMVSRK